MRSGKRATRCQGCTPDAGRGNIFLINITDSRPTRGLPWPHWGNMRGATMDFDRLRELTFKPPLEVQTRLTGVDSHTAGEINRIIIHGYGEVPGETMARKREYMMTELDWVRRTACLEPRGHRDIMAAALTRPVTPGAAFGLVYMDSRRYPFLCGTATIGAVITFIRLGLIPFEPPRTEILVDTPSGPMATVAYGGPQGVDSVGLEFVPSFVYEQNRELKLPGRKPLVVDTVCTGGFFVMVSSDQLGLDLTPANAQVLIDLGMEVIEAANEQLTVRHPTRPEVTTVDVTKFYDPAGHGRLRGRGAIVYGEHHLDRSPCGTGTAAKLALLHHRGELEVEQPFVNYGMLDTKFEAVIKRTTTVGDIPAVVSEVRGPAWITGLNLYLVEPDDPLKDGFLI